MKGDLSVYPEEARCSLKISLKGTSVATRLARAEGTRNPVNEKRKKDWRPPRGLQGRALPEIARMRVMEQGMQDFPSLEDLADYVEKIVKYAVERVNLKDDPPQDS